MYMYMYVYVHVCICTCMCIHMYIYICTHVCTQTITHSKYACIHRHADIVMKGAIFVCMYVCMHTLTRWYCYERSHICMHVCMHAFVTSREMHERQFRHSGEPYIHTYTYNKQKKCTTANSNALMSHISMHTYIHALTHIHT